MRKTAGILLITLGALYLYLLIGILVVFGISFLLVPFAPTPPQNFIAAVVLISLVVPAAFCVTGGIFCLRRKYWRVCLASGSFAVLFSVFNSVGSLLSSNIIILTGWIDWVMLVAAVIAVIFIVRTKKEW